MEWQTKLKSAHLSTDLKGSTEKVVQTTVKVQCVKGGETRTMMVASKDMDLNHITVCYDLLSFHHLFH